MDKDKGKDILLYIGLGICGIGSFILSGIKEKRDMQQAVSEEVDRRMASQQTKEES